MKEELRMLKKAIQFDIDAEIRTGRKVSPRGCSICAYTKKHVGGYRKDQPKKNRNHHSTLIRLTYRHFAKIKRATFLV
ncbi:MAG: hypothetical protein ACFFC7_25800 [Candidatus Hermodarchaeota archaeon]